MTLTKESEALLAEVYGTTMALTVFPARLAAIEAAIRAEQAAEVERLREALEDARQWFASRQVGIEVKERIEAALAAAPAVAPAPAPAEPRP